MAATGLLGGSLFLLFFGALASGVAFGSLLMCWAIVSTAVPQAVLSESVFRSAAIAFALSALCCLVQNALSLVLLGLLLPVCCFAGLHFSSLDYSESMDARADELEAMHIVLSDTRHRIPKIMVWSMAVMWMAFGVIWAKWTLDSSWLGSSSTLVYAVASLVLIVFVVISRTKLRPFMTIQNLFWLIVPLIVIGFIAVNMESSAVRTAAYIALFVAMALAHVQLWTHFSALSSQGSIVPVQLFGWGWLSTLFGMFVGVLLSTVLMNVSLEHLTYLVLVAAAALTVVLMIVRYRIERIDREAAISTAKEQARAEEARKPLTLEQRIDRLAKEYSLTPRETQVALFLAQGRSQPFISEALFISKSTVNTHVGHIYDKLGVRTKQELIELVATSPDQQVDRPL